MEAQRTGVGLLLAGAPPRRAPRRKGGENRANRGPSRAERVYPTSFGDATTLLIAEKKMTSPVWPGASATAHCGGGSRCPRARSHTASIQAPGAGFLSRVNPSAVNTLVAGLDLACSGTRQSQASALPAKIMEPGCVYSVVPFFSQAIDKQEGSCKLFFFLPALPHPRLALLMSHSFSI